MGLFEMPAELPTGADGLDELRAAAQAAFNRLLERADSDTPLTDEELAELRVVVDGLATIDAAIGALVDRADEIAALLERGAPTADEDPADEDTDEDPADADPVLEDAETPEREPELVASTSGKRSATTRFAGTRKGEKVVVPRGTGPLEGIGYRMTEAMPGRQTGPVTLRDIAESIATMSRGYRPRGDVSTSGAMASLPLYSLRRGDAPAVTTSQELVAAISEATALSNLVAPTFDAAGSLTAAGGWCAPSEQLYDFCEVPLATDLLVLPEVNISNRGGIRWPIEPDLSDIFESFEWFFTEPELEGTPAPLKTCVEIPCVDEFAELRLAAVGWCVEAGILQAQAWPELIEWFMASLTQEHFRALSRRSLLDMEAGSTPVSYIGVDPVGVSASTAMLNGIELAAVNLRLKKGLSRTHPIEVVLPNWAPSIVRADVAQYEGVSANTLSDAEVDGWFSARSIRPQYVADWQTREQGMPGRLDTLRWPGSIKALMYPAGTWFRSLTPVIEFGVQYPRELLQVNRFSRFFTEDAYAVGKRCDDSLAVTVPVCPNGGYGEAVTVTCTAAADEVQRVTITGNPNGGGFRLTFLGQTTSEIAYNATAADVQSALLALANIDPGDVSVSGGDLPTTPIDVAFVGRYAGSNVPRMTVTSTLTGGSSPTVRVETTTEGGAAD